MAKKKADKEPAADLGPQIVVEAANGVRTVIASPSGYDKDRVHVVDGLHYEHVTDDENGLWVYRAL